MDPALVLRDVRKSFGATKAVDGISPHRAARRAVRRDRSERRRQDDVHQDDHVDPVSGLGRAVGARSALGARGQGSHRLPAGGARRLPQDEGRRVSRLHGAAERHAPATTRRHVVPKMLESMNLPGTGEKALRGSVEGHAAARAVHRRGDSPARSAHSRRAVQRPGSGQRAPAARAHRARASARRDGAAVHARHGERGRDVPARGDDPPGTQGARRARRRAAAAVRSADHSFRAARSWRRSVAASRGCQASSASRRLGEGYTVLLVEGTDPAGAIARLAAAVPPARVELARLRLEDVFIRIVSEGATGSDAARALRAGLQAPGAEGAFA